ncbi:hypothetical protein D9M70_311480 [compost metagenome]
MNCVWWIVESHAIPDLSVLSPTLLTVNEVPYSLTDARRYSLRFSTEASVGEITAFYGSLFDEKGVLAKSWPNQCMFYPANLGYRMALEDFNRFVDCYCLTYSHRNLEGLVST